MNRATTGTAPEAEGARRGSRSVARRWVLGGLASTWYVLTTFAPLDLPGSAVVVVLGVLVMLSVQPDRSRPGVGVAASRRNVALAVLTIAAAVPAAVGIDLLLGRIPIEAGHAVLATSAAVAVFLPRLADTVQQDRPAVLAPRELILAVTAVVAFLRTYQASEMFLVAVAFTVLAPVVMAIRRVRLGATRLTRRVQVLQAANLWLFLVLLGAAALTGMFYLWRVFAPDSWPLIVGSFWVGLAATAALALFPPPRISGAANVLVALASAFLALQLVALSGAPVNPVTIAYPSSEEWQVVSGGRSTLVNGHWTLTVQQNAIDLVQVVDGRTHRGDRLEDFQIFGDPVLAVADGRVTAAVDSQSDAPVGGSTWHDMAGNHVILDIGGGHHVLYAHLKLGSIRVRPGDAVQRGQVIGQVGDSGNSDEPHLHIQVQNTPTFDVEDRNIRTHPILFDDTTVTDPRRGDSVAPNARSR